MEKHEPLPLSTTIHHWKETGSALAETLSKYLELCLVLSKASDEATTTKEDLVSQLDSVLQPGELLSVLSGQLMRSQEILTKARNKLVSPAHRLPTEVISKIFLYFVYAEVSDSPIFAEFRVREIYSRLHTLLGVCSVWRNIGISMPMLWQLIPAIRGWRFTLSYAGTSLSLNRSGTLPLDLGMTIARVVPNNLIADLAQHASRFRTINIVAEVPSAIQNLLSSLMDHNVSNSLSKLSLCVTDTEHIDRLGPEPYYMFLPDNETSERQFSQLVQSLTRFRCYGATLNWTSIAFFSRLVEIRLHSVIIGNDYFLHSMLLAISTASELQKLDLISITSFPESIMMPPFQLVFSKLQSLVLEDLRFNTLSIILHSIIPLSYKLTLAITNRCLTTVTAVRNVVPQPIDRSELWDLLEGVPVENLLLENQNNCPDQYTLAIIMDAMMSIGTLMIDGWTIDEEFCTAFTKREQELDGWEIDIPKIRDLSLTNVRIDDREGLRRLIRSHNLESIFLSGHFNHGPKGSEALEDWHILAPWDNTVEWLAGDIPSIAMSFGNYSPPEFRSAIWQLW